MAGYVKLHRCVLNKAIWKNQNLFRVFSWCLMKASWNNYEQLVGMTKVLLEPGQFIYGRTKASEETGLHESTIRNCINWLKENNTITIKSTNKFSVVTVINWELYQSDDDMKDSKKDSNSDNSGTTTGQQQDTTKKVKKVKSNISPFFEEFWKLYPQHRRGEKARVQKYWDSLKVDEHLLNVIKAKLIESINSQAWKNENGQYVPASMKWLKERRWENEAPIDKPQQPKGDGIPWLTTQR